MCLSMHVILFYTHVGREWVYHRWQENIGANIYVYFPLRRTLPHCWGLYRYYYLEAHYWWSPVSLQTNCIIKMLFWHLLHGRWHRVHPDLTPCKTKKLITVCFKLSSSLFFEMYYMEHLKYLQVWLHTLYNTDNYCEPPKKANFLTRPQNQYCSSIATHIIRLYLHTSLKWKPTVDWSNAPCSLLRISVLTLKPVLTRCSHTTHFSFFFYEEESLLGNWFLFVFLIQLITLKAGEYIQPD